MSAFELKPEYFFAKISLANPGSVNLRKKPIDLRQPYITCILEI